MAKAKDYDEIRNEYETKETVAQRQNKRRQKLDELARAAGWTSWSQFETALKNGEVKFPQKPK